MLWKLSQKIIFETEITKSTVSEERDIKNNEH